jgi:hypothetical protein
MGILLILSVAPVINLSGWFYQESGKLAKTLIIPGLLIEGPPLRG